MAKRKIIDVNIEVEHITNWIKNYFIKNGPNSKAIIGISGGKDSTIAAALLCRALGKDRVVGVIMPDGTMSDFTIAKDVCGYLGINSIVVDIGSITSALYRAIDDGYDDDHCIKNNPAVSTNTPARIRMSVLYALAAEMHGRVVNTCNKSEDYVGYSTKYGDLAGDFSVLSSYCVREVKEIGTYLGLPDRFIHKIPSDGMCGKTDEDNLGFTYEVLDAYILDEVYPDYDTLKNIKERHDRNLHKVQAVSLPSPNAKSRHREGEPYEPDWEF